MRDARRAPTAHSDFKERARLLPFACQTAMAATAATAAQPLAGALPSITTALGAPSGSTRAVPTSATNENASPIPQDQHMGTVSPSTNASSPSSRRSLTSSDDDATRAATPTSECERLVDSKETDSGKAIRDKYRSSDDGAKTGHEKKQPEAKEEETEGESNLASFARDLKVRGLLAPFHSMSVPCFPSYQTNTLTGISE
jgi:hypothetical protein